jgi:sorbitol-specific phosphotransferase system component IIC
MRSIVIRAIVLALQFILVAIAVHLLNKLITRFLEASLKHCQQLPMVEFLPAPA